MKKIQSKLVITGTFVLLLMLGLINFLPSFSSSSSPKVEVPAYLSVAANNNYYAAQKNKDSKDSNVKDFADSRDEDCKDLHNIALNAEQISVQQNLPKQLLKKSALRKEQLNTSDSQQAYFIQRQRC